MRLRLYFITLVISLLCSVNGIALPTTKQYDSEVSQPISEHFTHDNLPNKEFSLSSAQYIVHFNEENGITLQVRTQHAGSHSQSAPKNPFRLIKHGKNIDIRQHPFMSASMVHLASIDTADRYLYALRRIRI